MHILCIQTSYRRQTGKRWEQWSQHRPYWPHFSIIMRTFLLHFSIIMRTFLLHFFYLSSQLDNLLVSCSKCWMWRTIIHWPRMIARGGWTKAYPSNTAISLCTEDLCKCIVGLPKYAYVNVISLQLWPLYHKLFHLCLVITNKQNNILAMRAIIHIPTWVICLYIYIYIYISWVGVIIKEKKKLG